jgi:DNA-binding response OmpR family regulator
VKVLIADDDFEMRSLLSGELQEEGYLVCQACDGQETLDCLPLFRPDLVITDLRMPDGGIRLVGRLKTAAPNTPIIVMTAFGSADIEAQVYQSGATAYISKPFRVTELKTTMCRLLGRDQKEEQSSG